MFEDTSPRARARQLILKLTASPLLPVLGYTKTVETLVAGGPTRNWLAYAVFVTLLWIVADDLHDAAAEAMD